MPKVCLSMIVKDEEAVIERCLDSVLPHVDLLCIHDTGSIDGTKEKILQSSKKHGVHGRLIDSRWVDYAHNRNQALESARKLLACDDDYIMVMDADDVLRQPDWRDAPRKLGGQDGYWGNYHLGNLDFRRPILIRAGIGWRYFFPVHELLLRQEGDGLGGLGDSELHVDCNVGGTFQGADHFRGHATILERYLEEHPDCARSQFYLGQSYHCAGETQKAIKAYAKRTQMEGWDEEKLVAWLRVGELANDPGAFLEASVLNPTRVEGLCGAAQWCKDKGLTEVAKALAVTGLARLQSPAQGLFIDTDAPRRIQLLNHDLRT